MRRAAATPVHGRSEGSSASMRGMQPSPSHEGGMNKGGLDEYEEEEDDFIPDDDEGELRSAQPYSLFGSRGGIISRAKVPNELDEIQKKARKLPGPGHYNNVNPNEVILPSGGKFSKNRPKSALDMQMDRSRKIPAPGQYDVHKAFAHSAKCTRSASATVTSRPISAIELASKSINGPSPGPGHYTPYRRPETSTGTRSDTLPRYQDTELDSVIRKKKFIPGPAAYKSERSSLSHRNGFVSKGRNVNCIQAEIEAHMYKPSVGSYTPKTTREIQSTKKGRISQLTRDKIVPGMSSSSFGSFDAGSKRQPAPGQYDPSHLFDLGATTRVKTVESASRDKVNSGKQRPPLSGKARSRLQQHERTLTTQQSSSSTTLGGLTSQASSKQPLAEIPESPFKGPRAARKGTKARANSAEPVSHRRPWSGKTDIVSVSLWQVERLVFDADPVTEFIKGKLIKPVGLPEDDGNLSKSKRAVAAAKPLNPKRQPGLVFISEQTLHPKSNELAASKQLKVGVMSA